MLWSVALSLIVACCGVFAQPTICSSNEQCHDNHYCELSAKICRECINCEVLKREPPAHDSPCIKSVAECGPCLKGLIIDHQSYGDAQCVNQTARDEGATFPLYGWVLIVIGVLILAAVVVVYVLRNPSTFKILASTRASFQSPSYRTDVATNLPDAPPPYNPHYEPVRPESPNERPASQYDNARDEETAKPFIKTAPSSRPQGHRESGDNQSAIPYNLPVYVRYEHPPSPESETTPEPENEVNDNHFVVIDEDTMESNWSCNPNNGNSSPTNGAGQANGAAPSTAHEGGNTSDSMALALRETMYGPSAPKKLRTAQDTNNNRNRESSTNSEHTNNPHILGSRGKNEVVNVINLQVNTVIKDTHS